MKISLLKFVIIFVLCAHIFQFATNSILGEEIGLYPNNGDWYSGSTSSVPWKRTFASIIYPVRMVLIEPLSFLAQDPDPVPPLILILFTVYYTGLAILIYYLYYFLQKGRSHKGSLS